MFIESLGHKVPDSEDFIQVTKIEGVFSGTMSYIFNNFSTSAAGGPSFSSVVKVARESGYTVIRSAHR